MNKKEQTFEEYKKLYFEYTELLGIKPSPNKYDTKFYDKYDTRYFVKLKEDLIANITKQKRQNIINEWFKTEEGIKWYNEKKNRYNEVIKILSESTDNLKRAVRPLLMDALGKEWQITSIYTDGMTISLMEIKEGDTTPSEKFGHHFELTWGDNRRYYETKLSNDFRLYLNYGSMGSFAIEENSSRIKLIVGMSKLLTNKPLMDKLTDVIYNFFIEHERLIDEKFELREEMKNPSVIKIEDDDI